MCGQRDTPSVSALVDRHGYAQLSTAEVEEQEAFAYWREMICATFVRLAAEPLGGVRFSGSIEHVPVGDVELSTVIAGGQRVRRTRGLISTGTEEYLLASIQLEGRGRVEQDGRVAELAPGEMAFYDSTRPYALHFDQAFRQLVVQVPQRELWLRDTRGLTGRTLGSGTPGPVVAAFFRSLSEAVAASADGGAGLVPHAIGLLSAAATYASGTLPGHGAVESVTRQRVVDFLRGNLFDSSLDAETVAKACNVSRRTLYRMLDGEGVATRLRRMRIERARELLVADRDRPVDAVASVCGFESESGFYRAFRAATGQTPAEYRRRCGTGGQ